MCVSAHLYLRLCWDVCAPVRSVGALAWRRALQARLRCSACQTCRFKNAQRTCQCQFSAYAMLSTMLQRVHQGNAITSIAFCPQSWLSALRSSATRSIRPAGNAFSQTHLKSSATHYSFPHALPVFLKSRARALHVSHMVWGGEGVCAAARSQTAQPSDNSWPLRGGCRYMALFLLHVRLS